MKLLVLAVVISAAIGTNALTDEEKKKIDTYTKECLKVSQVDEKLLEDAKKGIFTEDPKLKTHAFCFSKKAGFQNERGEIQLDVIRKKLSNQIKEAEDVEKLIDKCILAPEETAFRAMRCLHENRPNDPIV